MHSAFDSFVMIHLVSITLMSTSSRLVEERYCDTSVPDPLNDMFALLESKQGKDRAMLRKWGVWLTIRDPERGLRVSVRRSELSVTDHSAVASHVDKEVHKRKGPRGGPHCSFRATAVTPRCSKEIPGVVSHCQETRRMSCFL